MFYFKSFQMAGIFLFSPRFIQKYPSYPPSDETIEIGLDEVAKDLSKCSEFVVCCFVEGGGMCACSHPASEHA